MARSTPARAIRDRHPHRQGTQRNRPEIHGRQIGARERLTRMGSEEHAINRNPRLAPRLDGEHIDQASIERSTGDFRGEGREIDEGDRRVPVATRDVEQQRLVTPGIGSHLRTVLR